MVNGVGGDFYDFISVNEEQTAILIGDVMGHGVHASLLMAQIMGFLRSAGSKRSRPSEVIIALNEMLIELGDRTDSVLSCTMIYIVLDAPSGAGFFVNAGHHRPVLCDRTDLDYVNLGPTNILLGVEEFKPQEGCLTFESGQRMVFYTDGLPEAANADGELFGDERLHAAIGRCAPLPPEECVDAILETVDEYRGDVPQADDETIVVIDRV